MKKRASQKNMIRKTALYTEVSFYEPSRFPGLQLKSPFPSHIKMQWIWMWHNWIQWPDRSGFSPDSLFWK